VPVIGQIAAADFSLFPSWGKLPCSVKRLVLAHADLETRRALRMTDRETRRWVEDSTQGLVILKNEAVGWLRGDSGRFKSIHTVSFGKAVHIKQLSKLRSSIHSIDLRACHVVEPEAIADLRIRRWQSMQLGYWRESGDNKMLPSLFILSRWSLTRLGLDNMPIRYAGAATISRITTLRKLSLLRCSIPNRGAEALAKLPRLQKLVIDNNLIGYIGALALLRNKALTSLSIASNHFCDDGRAGDFWETISQTTLLTSLNVGQNNLGPEIVPFLASNPI